MVGPCDSAFCTFSAGCREVVDAKDFDDLAEAVKKNPGGSRVGHPYVRCTTRSRRFSGPVEHWTTEVAGFPGGERTECPNRGWEFVYEKTGGLARGPREDPYTWPEPRGCW